MTLRLSVSFISLILAMSPIAAGQQTAVKIGFGTNNVRSIEYAGSEFMKSGEPRVTRVILRDAAGTREGNLQSSVVANSSLQEITRTYSWGVLRFKYATNLNQLSISISVTNTSTAAIDSLAVEPVILQFPTRVKESDATTPIVFHNIGAPTVLEMRYDVGVLVLVNEDVAKPLMLGFPVALDTPMNRTFAVAVNTGANPYSDMPRVIGRPIAPGGSDEYRISMRFGSPGSSAVVLAKDVFERFAAENPLTFGWTDRRPVGTLFLATAATGWETNPRGWLLDPRINILTTEGRHDFRNRLLAWADQSVRILRDMNAQGVIAWDLEGEQYPHPVTYIGDPRLIGALAPEMEPLVDEFIGRFRAAGLRIGLALRPQLLHIPSEGGTPRQVDTENPAQVLIEKIDYAKRRWGATIFYIDSNGDPNLPIDSKILRSVAGAHPDVLLVPEHENVGYFAFSAPYNELRGGITSTPVGARAAYNRSFSLINTADGPIQERFDELVQSVQSGDILLFRSWYTDPANDLVREIYRRVVDVTPPNVALTSIQHGAQITGTTVLSAWASDNLGLAGVQFKVDGTPIGPESTTDPYRASFSTLALSNGSHTLTAVARDRAGNTASADVQVSVHNERHATCPEIGNDSFAGCYYAGPDLAELRLVRGTGSIDFNWGHSLPLEGVASHDFSALWQGTFTFNSGEYSFEVLADDNARLFIDGEMVVNAWDERFEQPITINRRMTGGTHFLRVEFRNREDAARARVVWRQISE
jgi:hypothetical protein